VSDCRGRRRLPPAGVLQQGRPSRLTRQSSAPHGRAGALETTRRCAACQRAAGVGDRSAGGCRDGRAPDGDNAGGGSRRPARRALQPEATVAVTRVSASVALCGNGAWEVRGICCARTCALYSFFSFFRHGPRLAQRCGIRCPSAFVIELRTQSNIPHVIVGCDEVLPLALAGRRGRQRAWAACMGPHSWGLPPRAAACVRGKRGIVARIYGIQGEI